MAAPGSRSAAIRAPSRGPRTDPRTTAAAGRAKAIVVSGRVMQPHPTHADSKPSQRVFAVSVQRSSAHQPSSQRAVVVAWDRYEARSWSGCGGASQKSQARIATRPLAARRASATSPAPAAPASAIGTAAVIPRRTPGASTRACPGGYLAARKGPESTCIWSKKLSGRNSRVRPPPGGEDTGLKPVGILVVKDPARIGGEAPDPPGGRRCGQTREKRSSPGAIRRQAHSVARRRARKWRPSSKSQAAAIG